MATLASLVVKISGETGALVSALQQSETRMQKFANAAESAGSKLKTLAAVAVGAVAGFAVVSKLEDAVNSTQELGDSVLKLSRETGLAAEDSSRLLFAFKHVGLDAADASKSIGIFAKGLKGIEDTSDGAVESTKPMAAILKDIGLTALDAAGNIRPVNELIPELADKFKAMPDGLEKTALAMQLFGRSGKDMIPLLNQGSAGLADLGKEADKLGVTLSAGNVDQIKQYTLAQRDMGEAVGGLKLQIGLALMPKLTELSQWFTANQPAIRAFTADAIDKLDTALGGLVDAVQKVAPEFKSSFATMADGFDLIKPGLAWVLDNQIAVAGAFTAIGIAALLAFTPVTGPVLAITAALGGLVFIIGETKKAWDDLVAANDKAAASNDHSRDSQITLQKAVEGLGWAAETTGIGLKVMGEWAMNIANGDLMALEFAIGQISDQTGILRDHIVDDWLPAMGKAWSGLLFEVDWIPGFFSSMEPILGGVADSFWTVEHAVEGLIDAIERIPNPGDIYAGIGHALHIPGFAAGVTDFSGGLALVGEKGPEIVDLPRSVNIIPAGPTRQMLSQGAAQGGGGYVTNNYTNHYHIDNLRIEGDGAAGLASLGGMVA